MTEADTLDEIYQRLIKDGGADDGVPVPCGYPMRVYDRATVRSLKGDPKWDWPRLRDLPESERQEFSHWLMDSGLTVPLLDIVLAEDQDGYFPHDYDDWKNKRRACRP